MKAGREEGREEGSKEGRNQESASFKSQSILTRRKQQN